jgi:hypothetical protein
MGAAVKERLHYRRPKSVGENPGSDLAVSGAIMTLVGTSFLASYVVDRMTGFAVSGFGALWGWGAWWAQATNWRIFYGPGQHANTLTAYGWSVVTAIEITWIVGGTLAALIFIAGSIIAAPRSDQDVAEMHDSAKMATEADLREAGFLAVD